jgi:hypothetical protein
MRLRARVQGWADISLRLLRRRLDPTPVTAMPAIWRSRAHPGWLGAFSGALATRLARMVCLSRGEHVRLVDGRYNQRLPFASGLDAALTSWDSRKSDAQPPSSQSQIYVELSQLVRCPQIRRRPRW